MIDWKNKKVAVLGLGVEGLSSVRFLIKNGARVTVLDKKSRQELLSLFRHSGTEAEGRVRLLDKGGKPSLAGRIQNLSGQGITAVRDSGVSRLRLIPRMTRFEMMPKIIGGENYLKNLDKFDVIVRSPGVKRSLPEIINAEENGVVITSQTKIFFDVCPSPIIGVTGTKGKGTTATLIYEMLRKSFDSAQDKKVYLGGNIGKPPFEFLDKLNTRSFVVLELSSFQLQDLTKSPHIAIMLMTTSEHLDYHKDIQEYVDAKRNILRFQKETDFAIINKDYPASRESDVLTNGKVFGVSREGEGEEGCFVKEGKVVVCFGSPRPLNDSSVARGPVAPSSHPMSSVASSLRALDGTPSSRATPRLVEIIDIKDILLPGKHNLENVCAAVMTATLAGVSKENIVKVLKTFKGLEHRLELVGEIKGVKYYDDSFSTIPETAIAAIKAFTQPEILILGGSSKGSDFTELGRVISNAKNIRAIIGIGKEWHKIKSKIIRRSPNQKSKIIRINKHLRGGADEGARLLDRRGKANDLDSSEVDSLGIVIIEERRDMGEIVAAASRIARVGDVVLLSPACASFDMFKNYKDRGEQFKKEVKMLKKTQGLIKCYNFPMGL